MHFGVIMRNSNLIISSAVAIGAIFVVGAAWAADLPARTYTKAPPMANPSFDWSGCYVGGNVGVAFDRSNFGTALVPGSHLFGDIATVNSFFPVTGDDTRFTGGGQVGCNWQRGAFVAGLEGDFDFSGGKPSVTTNGNVGGLAGFNFSTTNSVKTDWVATVRPRIGWAWDTTLFYATGGLAVARLKYALTYSDTLPDAIGGASNSQTRLGWTVGGGVEHAVDRNWTVKVEYLYSQFDQVNAAGLIATQSVGPFTNVVNGSADLRMQTVRVGVNYKWGGPVVAKY
jgi:outer membrane immunogenic protein